MAFLNIRGRLILGFSVLCALLAIVVGITIIKVRAVNVSTDRTVNLRVPTAMAASDVVAGVYASLASLRGWLITGNDTFKAERALLWKEAWLGFLNGSLTGLVAGAGMFWVAHHQQHPQALVLALITFVAMAGSCAVSGIAGAAVPLGLRRLGADPATASSIFLTTATDVVSMGLFLGLAALLITAA